MFDKVKFAQIIKKISDTYDNQREFSKKSGINRTYLSQYMNMKLENPPKPNILNKLANSSNGITSYSKLMQICGYTDYVLETADNSSFKGTLEQIYLEYLTEIELSKEEEKIFRHLVEMLSPEEMQTKNLKYLIGLLSKNDKVINSLNEDSINKIVEKTRRYGSFLENEAKAEIDTEIDYNLKPINSLSELCLVPVLGKIAAGQPILAEEYIEGYLPVDPNIYGLKTSNDLFYLRVSGQSMNLKIKNGDYALIRKQDTAEDGDIIVAIVNSDDEATLKRYRRINDYTVRLEPMSTDTTIEEIEVDLRNTNLKIIGKAIGQFGKF